MTLKYFALTVMLLMLTISPTLASSASDLDIFEAKQAGLVGEKPDGMVGIVKDHVTELQKLVKSINEGRLQSYREIAGKQGVSLEEVKELAGTNLISKTPPGQYIMTSEGKWLIK